jgi:hypothetical protein
MPVTLPVYPLSPAPTDSATIEEIATVLFGLKGIELEELNDGTVGRSGSVTIELDRASGGVWAADSERLWNPARRPTLAPARRASETAAELLGRLQLLPRFDDGAPFALTELEAGGTIVAHSSGGQRTSHALDVQARYAVVVRNPGIDGEPQLLPVVGGGGKFALRLGDKSRPIAYQGAWRSAGEVEHVKAIDRREAHARFAELTSHLDVQDVSSFLAYHSAPVGVEQELLTPVYVFRATILVDDKAFPMRLVTLAATEFGPIAPEPQPQPKRARRPGRVNGTLGPRRTALTGNPFEAGTSWIGQSGGLVGSQANAQGFVDGLAADGWLINFNWGDANAWESDWRRNDDTWVDAADFVFYTGHANLDGWVLAAPDDGALTSAEVGASPATPGDLWGQQDLEWVIIAACGPLQDDFLAAGGGDVLDRWDGAFDGLHSLMGYGAITYDNTEEGKRVVQYARQGTPVIDAWLRTGQEIQPSSNGASAPDGPTVWVGAMWVTNSGADPRLDHLWGHGSVSPDPTSPTGLVCMWTSC